MAGTVVYVLPKVGISLIDYPKLSAWSDRLIARPSWQATQITPEMIKDFRAVLEARKAQQATS